MAVAQQEIEQATALAQQGESEAAVALLSQLIQRDASNVAAWLALSDVVDDPERAEYCLQKVLNLDPGNSAALERLSESKGGSLSVGSVGGFNQREFSAGTDEAPAAENMAEAAYSDAEEPGGSPEGEAQLHAAAAAPAVADQVPAGRSSIGRTDLILISLTVLAGVVLCALVSAALI